MSPFWAAGCSNQISQEPTQTERLMLPERIEIQPFTSIRSFNEDDLPDGILLVLRPVDHFGDPVKAAGYFYFELWTYVNASGERKGERLAFWERDVASENEMRTYWTHAQMFEFQLAWAGQGADQLRPGRKYVLTATWRTPWDQTVRDEYVLDFHLPFETLTRSGPPSGADLPLSTPATRPVTR